MTTGVLAELLLSLSASGIGRCSGAVTEENTRTPVPTTLLSLSNTARPPPPRVPLSTEQGWPGRTLLARSPPLLVYHFDVAILHQQVVGLIAVPSLKARWDLLDFIPPSKILHRQQEEAGQNPGGSLGTCWLSPMVVLEAEPFPGETGPNGAASSPASWASSYFK